MPLPATQHPFDLAVRHHKAGELQQAERLCREIAAQQPEHANAVHLLGIICLQLGNPSEAAEWIGRAVALRPNWAEAHNNLGNVLSGLGRMGEALAAYRHAIAGKPGFAEAYANLGNVLEEQGDLAGAIAALRQAVALKPNLAEAHCNLGAALKAAGQFEEAILEFQKTVELKPDFAEAHSNLGDALRENERLDEAVAACRRAISLKPSLAEAYNNLGLALKDMGRFPEAMEAYRKSVELNSGHADGALSNLGAALCDLGRFDEAADCFRRAIAIDPKAATIEGLIGTGRGGAGASEIERLTALLDEPGLAIEERIHAEFALGKLHDEGECFDAAFAHFSRANQLFKESRAAAGVRWDGGALRRRVNRAIEAFSPEFFQSRRAWGEASELPVFIVGMPRSGTSLVEQIAASHPAVFGAGELETIGSLAAEIDGISAGAARQGADRPAPTLWTAPAITKAAHDGLQHLRAHGGAAQRVTDKLPANVFNLGFIATLFPKARVIFCRRDLRDNCLSCYFQQFTKNGHLYAYDLADCAWQQMETDRLMAHWLGVLPVPMLEIQYETLVEHQEAQSRRLIDFLGLPWDPACLRFHATQRPVLTASAWQVRQPMYSRSVGRWRHYERHLGPLHETLKRHTPANPIAGHARQMSAR